MVAIDPRKKGNSMKKREETVYFFLSRELGALVRDACPARRRRARAAVLIHRARPTARTRGTALVRGALRARRVVVALGIVLAL